MSQVISQWGQLAREWSERGRRDIDHKTRGARVREREANESILWELGSSSGKMVQRRRTKRQAPTMPRKIQNKIIAANAYSATVAMRLNPKVVSP